MVIDCQEPIQFFMTFLAPIIILLIGAFLLLPIYYIIPLAISPFGVLFFISVLRNKRPQQSVESGMS